MEGGGGRAMRRRRNGMRGRMLMRPANALFPLSMLAAICLGRGEAALALMRWHLLLQLCGFCAADCFRLGAVREPGVRRVDRRFFGGIVQFLMGAALALLAERRISLDFFAALCIGLERFFEERLYARCEQLDGALLSGIASLLLLTGLQLDGGAIGFYTLCGALLGALIGLLANLVLARFRGHSSLPCNLLLAPRALLQSALYPALAICAVRALRIDESAALAPFLSGLILWRLAQSPAPRGPGERLPLALLVLFALLSALVARLINPALRPHLHAILLSALCIACATYWRAGPAATNYRGGQGPLPPATAAGRARCHQLPRLIRPEPGPRQEWGPRSCVAFRFEHSVPPKSGRTATGFLTLGARGLRLQNARNPLASKRISGKCRHFKRKEAKGL